MVEFGTRLRHLRKEKNLTQKQLASLIGVQHTVISFYELGDRIPSPQIIKKLAATLHVSSDYLLGIEKHDVLSLEGLDEDDKLVVRTLVETLRNKHSLPVNHQ